MTGNLYDQAPDSAYPMLHGMSHRPLVELPDRATGIRQRCEGCGREVWFGGRDICRLFPDWLTRDIWLWAMAMKCDDCPSPRQSFAVYKDAAAGGFSLGASDPWEAQRIRRLMAWLPEGGRRIDDVAYLIRDVDPRKLRETGFSQDVVDLFFGHINTASHFHPTRQPARGVIPSC
ncbi:hypothetical protein [Brevundimonas sp.]|jgi:hypothetical protein|uniref:hypothetical protein n=1 Tax=Brevundimonas sp. TaxID=1871086 RepID=UPI001A340266|nr:hypothetical protein [Brevundimonas sp.]MBJ7509718.1 hypothetical protein [Brevundimonas sp.]